MTIEFIEPQTLIRKQATVGDFLKLKNKKEIYFNGKLLPEDFDQVYKDTLIDYAGLSFIKKLYLSSETETMQDGCDKKERDLNLLTRGMDFGIFTRLTYNFAWDLRSLYNNLEFTDLISYNSLARQLMVMVEFQGGRYDEIGQKLIKNLDEFKVIIDKIEYQISSQN